MDRLAYPDRPDAAARALAWATGVVLPPAPRLAISAAEPVEAAGLALAHPGAVVDLIGAIDRVDPADPVDPVHSTGAQATRIQAIAQAVGVSDRLRGVARATPGAYDLAVTSAPESGALGPWAARFAKALAPSGALQVECVLGAHLAAARAARRAVEGLLGAPACDVAVATRLLLALDEAAHLDVSVRAFVDELVSLTPAARAERVEWALAAPRAPATCVEVADALAPHGLTFAGVTAPALWAADLYFPEAVARALERLEGPKRLDALAELLGPAAPPLSLVFAPAATLRPTPSDAALLAGHLAPTGPWRFIDLAGDPPRTLQRGLWQAFPEPDGTIELRVGALDLVVSAEEVRALRAVGAGARGDEALRSYAAARGLPPIAVDSTFLTAVRALLAPPIGLLVFGAT